MPQDEYDPGPDLEARVARELAMLLAGVSVGAAFTLPPSAHLCASLERFLPQELARRHPEWAGESLDGVFLARAVRTGPRAAELTGTCILLTDQTVTPLTVALRLSPEGDRIDGLRVRLGEPGGGPLRISGPACNSRQARTLLANVVARVHEMDWCYEISRGEAGPREC